MCIRDSKDVAKQLADRFGFEKVAITLRESISANDNNWSAMLYEDVYKRQVQQKRKMRKH